MIDAQEAARLITSADAVLFDWDGCLAVSGALLPGAREILSALADRSYILSNNSTDHPRDLAGLLEYFDVVLPLENVLLAGHQTLLREASRHGGRAINIVAAPQMVALAAELGLMPVHFTDSDVGEVETLVIMRDTSFTFRKLTAAVNAARACKRIVVSNPDLTHPGGDGSVQPETGALLAAIQSCLGNRSPVIEVIGKPNPFLFLAALDKAGVAPGDAVMIGDNPTTDGAGARACGMPFVQVHPEGPLSMAVLAEAVFTILARTP
ncbi:MAG: HAD family hydrolase [Sphingobium limneticum]